MKWLLMVQGVFLFLTSALTQGSAQFRCFTTPSSAGEFNCGTADGEFEAASIEECCLSPNGQFFEPRAGPEGCTACIVFGWFHGTDITLSERTSTYDLQAGFIKGGAVQTFVTAQGLARFEIAVEERGAVEGVNADFVVQDTSHSLFGANPSPFNVPITVRVDGIALEPAEGFALSLDPTNPTAMDIFAAVTPGLFVIPEISVVIQDLENALLQFTEARYSRVESKRFIQPQLQLSMTIAVDLVVEVIPLNLTFARASGQLPTSLDPIQTDPNFDPLTQTATSVADFSITPVQVTFASERSPETIEFEMNIADDTIHEADQIFALTLEVLRGVDPRRLIPERADGLTSLGRIIDDDSIVIGFEEDTYTVSEASGNEYSIPPDVVIKGNNQKSELRFDVIAQFIDGTATRVTRDTIGDYITFEPRVTLLFRAAVERIGFYFDVINDRLPEPDEEFSIALTTLGAPRVVVGQDGGPFSSARIVITDEDVLTIGWERNLTTVNETQGSVQLCLRILDVDDFAILTGFSVMLFIGTIRGTAADPGDYTELRTDSTFVIISDANRGVCFDVVINDDALLEEVEFFSVQVVSGPDGLLESIRLAPDLTFVEILDNDFIRIGFNQTTYTVTEGVDAVATVFVAVLEGELRRRVTVTFSTEVLGSDTATAGTDFGSLTTTLVFDENTLVVPVDVTIANDDVFEPLETFTVSLVRNPADPVNVVMINLDAATVSIQDEDVVVIGYQPVEYTVNEDVSTGVESVFIRVLEGDLTGITVGNIVTVDVSATSFTATAGSDFSFAARTVSFVEMQTECDIPVSILDDPIIEDLEVFFILAVSSAERVVVRPDHAMANVTIIDDESALTVIGFVETAVEVGEAAGPAILNVALLSGILGKEVSVDFTTLDGTALAPGDYTTTITTLTFGPSSVLNVPVPVPVDINNDNLLEFNETFTASLTITEQLIAVLPSVSTVTIITDTDNVAIIGFTQDAYDVIEDAGFINVTVAVLNARLALGREVIVTLQTRDGTAVSDSAGEPDFMARTVTLTFSSSMTSIIVPIFIIDNLLLEMDREQFISMLTLVTSDPDVILQPASVPIEIIDNDGVVIGFEQIVYTTTEGSDASVELCAVLTMGTLKTDAIVTFFTSDGSAMSRAPSDYDAATTAFTFDPSNNRQCETVIINNDDILEGTEDFFGSLTTNDAGVTLTPDNVRVDILEDGERCTKATN